MVFEGLGRKIDIAFKRTKAYATYNRFDDLEDLVKHANQGKNIVKEEGTFYIIEGDKKEKAFIPAHYNCPDCGIIKGVSGTRDFNDGFGPLSGGYGFEDYCKICDNIIGRTYSVRS